MANELRVRTNFVAGLVEDAPLTSGATSMTSASLAAAPPIGTGQHWPIVLDPAEANGDAEVVYLVAHSASATGSPGVTILRAQEDTVARAHPAGTTWVHAPTARDYSTRVDLGPVALGAHSASETNFTWYPVTGVCTRGIMSTLRVTALAAPALFDLQLRSEDAGLGELFLEAVGAQDEYLVTAPVYVEGTLSQTVYLGVKNREPAARTYQISRLRVERFQ